MATAFAGVTPPSPPLVHAIWEVVPGGSVLGRLLWFGNRPARWFSHVDPGSSALPPRYRPSPRLLRLVLVTTLRPRAPLILLNVALGDEAEMNGRACGSPVEGLGWATHLHTMRSSEKVTAGGMAGPTSPGELATALPEALAAGSPGHQVMALRWQGGGGPVSRCGPWDPRPPAKSGTSASDPGRARPTGPPLSSALAGWAGPRVRAG